MNNDNDKIIEIFSGNEWECEMVKTLLIDEGITCFLRNDLSNIYALTAPESVRIMISESDYDRAKVIVDRYLLSKQHQ
ncbi:MAG: DUF2007 domain-containing protein [Rikenellaceae bacterium]